MGILIDTLNKKKILVSDGAWGTFLYKRGLKVGECPELWNDTHPSDVLAIADSYVDAGADIILTNSFGGSPIKLSHYDLEKRAIELNQKAAEISKKAAAGKSLVVGSIGPTGAILMMGEYSEQQLYDSFYLQAEALKKGGVDAICVETMSAIDEAVLAVKAAYNATGLDIVCTFTFDNSSENNYRTMIGVKPSDMIEDVKNAGAKVIGSNCGNGFDQMIGIVKEIRSVDKETPVLVHANAGLPKVQNSKTVYPETAEMMASKVDTLIKSGANIIGGCCGTTPKHIRLIAEKVRELL
jgi:5-methyltetrahydrofolate--homocysteine methyltransferase